MKIHRFLVTNDIVLFKILIECPEISTPVGTHTACQKSIKKTHTSFNCVYLFIFKNLDLINVSYIVS